MKVVYVFGLWLRRIDALLEGLRSVSSGAHENMNVWNDLGRRTYGSPAR
jgi:hypothetical protein